MFLLTLVGVTVLSVVWNCCVATPRDCVVQYGLVDITADCSGRGLTSVPTSLPTNVTELRLTRNKIKYVTGSALRGYPRLRILDLSYNELETVAWECLPVSLVELDLSNNLITDDLCTGNRQAAQPTSYTFPSLLTWLLPQHDQSQTDGDSIGMQTARGSSGTLTTSILPNLQVLLLDQNKLGRLTADCFYDLGPTFLEVLSLSHNQLDILPNGTFRGLNRLQKLVLSNNQLQQLELESLADLQHLQSLRLDSNNLHSSLGSLPPGVFRSQGQNLMELYIHGNRIAEDGKYPDEALADLTSVRILAIDTFLYYGDDSVFGPGFGAMRNLQVLDLSHNCHFNRLTNRTFQVFANSSLQVLHIDNNIRHLEIMEPCVFCPLKNLTSVFMTSLKNLMVSLDGGLATFYALQSRENDDSRVIDFVDMSYFLDHMSRNIGAQLTNGNTRYMQNTCVRNLDLQYNYIVRVEHNALWSSGSRFSSCIQSINLANNRLVYADMVAFINIRFAKRLESLEVQEQYLFRLNDALDALSERTGPSTAPADFDLTVTIPSTLTFVNISGSYTQILAPRTINFVNSGHMNNIDVSYVNFGSCAFVIKGVEKLETIRMSGSNCRNTSLSFFDCFPSLKTLVMHKMNFEQNFVATNGPRLFHKLNKLETFDLSFNDFKVLPPETFSGQPALRNLILFGNLLESLDLNLLYHKNLSFLDLSGNKLSFLTQGQRDMLDVLVAGQDNPLSLHLQGNPIACTCSTLDFVRWLGTTRVALDHGGDYACVTDNGQLSTTGTVGNQWLSVWRQCVGSRVMLSSMVGMLVLLSLTGLVWGVAKNYSRLRYLYSVLSRIQMPKRENFERDAYVAYCDADFELVIDLLRRELQVRRGVRLLIRDLPRDEAGMEFFQLPGDNLALNMLEHIDLCWKVVLVLTPDLIDDHLIGFMTRAVLLSITDRRPRRVLLLCVGFDHMPELANLEPLLEIVPEQQVFFLPRPDLGIPGMWDNMAEIILRGDP